MTQEIRYCGNCGRTNTQTKLRLFRTMPDGEKSYVCKDQESCRVEFLKTLKRKKP